MAAAEARCAVRGVSPRHLSVHLLRLLSSAIAVVLLLCGGAAQPAAAGSSHADATAAVIAAARSHLGAPYQFGSDGPRTFDCSGLVYRTFRETGQLSRIGGARRTAAGYMHLFAARGEASRSGGQPGDLVIYNGGTHVGIYVGKGKIISALVDGVRQTGLHALSMPFTEFLHTHLAGGAARTSVRHGGWITTRAAALRSGPRAAAHWIQRVPAHTHIKVLGTRSDGAGHRWLHVRLPGGSVGWLRRSAAKHT